MLEAPGLSSRTATEHDPMSILVDRKHESVVQGLTGFAGRFSAAEPGYGTKRRRRHQPPRRPKPTSRGSRVRVGRRGFAPRQVRTASMVTWLHRLRAGRTSRSGKPASNDRRATEGIPAQDECRFSNDVKRNFPSSRYLGTDCPGILTQDECNIGLIPPRSPPRGSVGISEPDGHAHLSSVERTQPEGHRVDDRCVGHRG